MELISRQHQLARLEDLLQRALHGQMQIATVTGDAGMGKTCLLDALIARAQQIHPELFVARSKCYEVAGTLQEPYTPFIQVLDSIVGTKRSNARWDLLRHSLVELAPDWLEYLPGGNLSAGVIRTIQWERELDEKLGNADKQRRMVQFTNALRLASYTAPILLAIDDMQWSDKASLELIQFLADQLSLAPVMLLILYRPSDVAGRVHGEAHPVRQMVSQLKRFNRCVEIEVPNFSKANTVEFLESQHCQLPDTLVDQLMEKSQGNPLFIREYLSLLMAKNVLHYEDSSWVLPATAEEIEIPNTIKAVIQKRLDLIAEDLRELLSHASVQGERFASQVLSGTLNDVPESRILKYLNQLQDDYRLVNELEGQGLVVKVGQEYRFVHALLQQVLYQELSEGQRRLLHQVIARLQESLYAEDIDRYAASLANHYEMGGNLPRAIQYYLRACQNALSIQAIGDALEIAHKTQALARRIQPNERKASLWLAQSLLQEAEILFWKGDYRAALTTTYEGQKLAEQNEQAEMQANFHYWASRSLRALGQIGESIESARQALQILGDHANPRLRGLLHAYMGSVSDTLPVEELNHHLNEALNIADANHLPDVKVKALLEMAGLSMYRTDRPADALQFARQAERIAVELNMQIEHITALRHESFACLRIGQFEEALDRDQQAVEIARQRSLPIALHLALFSLALSWSSGMDSPARGLEVLHESLSIAHQYNFPPSRNVYGAQFNLSFALGRWDEAHLAQDKFFESIRSSYQRGQGYHLRMIGHELYASGRYEEAIEIYRNAIAMYRKFSPDVRDVRTVEPYLGMAMIETGEGLEALGMLEEVSDFWKGRQPSRYARGLCALAEFHLKRSSCEQAIPLLRQALVAVERAPSDQPWPVRPQVSLALARALLLNGEKEEALSHAQWAYERYKRMGHFLSGDAAYWLGLIFDNMMKPHLAEPYFIEARQKWSDLGFEHRLKLFGSPLQEE